MDQQQVEVLMKTLEKRLNMCPLSLPNSFSNVISEELCEVKEDRINFDLSL